MTYLEYLQTNHWKRLRRVKLEQAGYACQRCDSTYFLQVHHRVYRKSWFDSIPEDLEAVCGYCHKKEHGILGINDRPIYTYSQRDAIVRKLCGDHKRTYRPPPKLGPKKSPALKDVKTICNHLIASFSINALDSAIEQLSKIRQEVANKIIPPR